MGYPNIAGMKKKGGGKKKHRETPRIKRDSKGINMMEKGRVERNLG